MEGTGYSFGVSAPTLTAKLNLALEGDAVAAERAWSEVYAEVRAIAAMALTHESGPEVAGADLQPTGLVHEVFLRLDRSPPREWESRRHFFGAVAQACERALIDLARLRNAAKRGGGNPHIPLRFVAGELADPQSAASAAEFGLPAVLSAFALRYPRAAEVARLRYMLGLPSAEIARALAVSESTVEKDWAFTRAWLRRELDRSL